MKKRGFTLIELIIVMCIIGILVMLAMPKYLEYQKDAKITRIIVQSKELEKACDKYYMVYQDWPRLNDEAYNMEQIVSFGERVLANTGKVIELDVDGNYYDIDYEKINNYIKVLKDKDNYILQNPVGNVYYLENLSAVGKERIKVKEEKSAQFEVTLNPDDKSQYANLTDDNLTVYGGSSPLTYRGIRVSERPQVDKVYVEFEMVELNNRVCVGFIDSKVNLHFNTTGLYNLPKGVKVLANTGIIYEGNKTVPNSTFKKGDIIGLLYDKVQRQVVICRNNVKIAEFQLDDGYDWKLGLVVYSGYDKCTVNFGSRPFKYPIPEGYQPYNTVRK